MFSGDCPNPPPLQGLLQIPVQEGAVSRRDGGTLVLAADLKYLSLVIRNDRPKFQSKARSHLKTSEMENTSNLLSEAK